MDNHSKRWHALARALRRKVNRAHWLDRAAVPVVCAAAAGAAILLWSRHVFAATPPAWIVAAAAALPLCAAAGVWFRARRDFLDTAQALVRLEVRHGLHAALSTARAGVGPWPPPPPPERSSDGLRWHWTRAGLPPFLAALLIAAALWVPVAGRPTPTPPAEPLAWSLIETDLHNLVEERVVEESSTQETREAIEALRARPQGEWFDHSSIEAGDRILLAHRRDMATLESRLRDAARAMRQATNHREGLQPGQRDHGGLFDEILEGLRTGGLRPDSELLDKLSELASENADALNQLTPAQLAEMLDQLEGSANALADMLEQLHGNLGPLQEGNGEGGLGEGADGEPGFGDDVPGAGGIGKGPGDSPGLFGDRETAAEAALPAPLPTGDLSRAAPGDMLGTGEAEHDIDPDVSPEIRSGGAPLDPGDGGGAVWSDTLHPREQDALRRFFD